MQCLANSLPRRSPHAQLEELVAMGLTDSELSNLLGISESR